MENLVALVVATLILVSIPGPNVALIVASSLGYGLRAGLNTVFGTTLGVAIQLALVVVGMATLIEYAADLLQWLRWGGVAYLIWLGIRAWRSAPVELASLEARPAVFWRACVVAAVNPKTLLFHAAFLPQFVGAAPSNTDLGTVAALFLATLMLGDMLWAVFANAARPLLTRATHLRNRISAAFLILAGVGLAISRR